jgi:hypothetical protein
MSPDCKYTLTQEFLYDKFTRSFIRNEYKEHRKNFLFRRAQQLFEVNKRELVDIVRIRNLEYEIIKSNYEISLNNQMISAITQLLPKKHIKYACPVLKCSKYIYNINIMCTCNGQIWFHYMKHISNNIEDHITIENLRDIDYILTLKTKKYDESFHKEDSKKYNVNKLKNMYNDIILHICKEYLRLANNSHKMEVDDFEVEISDIRNRAISTLNYIACSKENCNGLIMNGMVCALCNTYTCIECRDSVSSLETLEKHICDESKLKSIHLIIKESKSCPTCAISIQKKDGCDDMYCTNCKTKFSWRTLKLVDKNRHNPEEEAEMRRNNRVDRNPDDILCGRDMDASFIQNTLYHLPEKTIKKFKNENFNYGEYLRIILHTTDFLRNKIRRQFSSTNELAYTNGITKKFLNDEISEDEYKNLLFASERKIEVRQKIFTAINTFIFSIIEVLYRFSHDMTQFGRIHCISEQKHFDTIYNCVQELRQLFEIVNNDLQRISNVYSTTCHYVKIIQKYDNMQHSFYFGMDVITNNLLSSVEEYDNDVASL